jgi:hypothetical protein
MKFIIILALVIVACEPGESCTPEETRCDGAFVQICDGDSDWTDVQDCGEVESISNPVWACCLPADKDFHTCMPKHDCEIMGVD